MTSQSPETRIVDSYRVACDGGQGGLGHPRVWLNIPKDKEGAVCGYCDARLIHRDFAPQTDAA